MNGRPHEAQTLDGSSDFLRIFGMIESITDPAFIWLSDAPSMTRYDQALAAIDAANARDPNLVGADGHGRPAELVYGEYMTAMLARLYPDASEVLRLAVRAQHLRRWEVPRASYPMDRAGYHRWRNDLKRKHAGWAGEILRGVGYDEVEVARVAALIRKEDLKKDSEAQALEDTACLVFLEHYAAVFAAKHDEAKMLGILRKTWVKMSAHAQQAAFALTLPDPVKALIDSALKSQA